MSKSKLKLGLQISSSILYFIIHFESTTKFTGRKKNLMKNFTKFLSIPDMVREVEEKLTVDTREDEMIREDVWNDCSQVYMCPVQRSLVTGHWSLVMIQIYLQTAPWKPQDSTRWQ